MKRKVNIPAKPAMQREGDPQPRERRTLGVRFEQVSGESVSVSGLR